MNRDDKIEATYKSNDKYPNNSKLLHKSSRWLIVLDVVCRIKRNQNDRKYSSTEKKETFVDSFHDK